jgi:hypothetical protein
VEVGRERILSTGRVARRSDQPSIARRELDHQNVLRYLRSPSEGSEIATTSSPVFFSLFHGRGMNDGELRIRPVSCRRAEHMSTYISSIAGRGTEFI